MSSFQLILFGVPELRRTAPNDGETRLLGPGKPLILLARLCLEPAGLSRDQLAAFLWSDMPEERARASSRQALHVLRQSLGADGIAGDRQRVQLGAPLDCDVPAFLAATEAGDDALAVSLYRGPFLAEQLLPDANEAEEWIAGERRRLARLFVRAATRLVQHARHNGAWEQAVAVARRLRDEEPEVLTHWELLLDTLAQGSEREALDFELTALRARMEGGHQESRLGTRDTQRLINRFLDLTEPSPVFPADIDRPAQRWRGRFVGRRSELHRLKERWAQVIGRHQGHRLVITGHAGVGKSRLLAEFSRRPQSEGATVLWVQAKRGGRTDRYGFLADVVSTLTAQPGSLGIMQESAAALLGLVPSLATVFPGATWQESLQAPQQLVGAVRDLLATLADERALLLVLDDLHRADDDSLAILDAATSHLDGLSVLVIAASRPQAAQSANAWEQVTLGPLDHEQLGTLIADLEGAPITPPLLEQLVQVTGGLPLQAVQALRLMVTRGLATRSQGVWTLASTANDSPMVSLRDLVHATIHEQSHEARQLLAYLAVADATVGREQLTLALGVGASMDRSLRELEEADLIRAAGADEWQVAHDVVADAVLHALPLDERRSVSLAVATQALDALATRVLTASEMRRLVRLFLDAEAPDALIDAITQWHQRTPNAPAGAALADLLLGAGVAPALRRRLIRAIPDRRRSMGQTIAAIAATLLITMTLALWWLQQPATLELVNTPVLLSRAGVPPIFEVHDHLGRISKALDGDTVRAIMLFGRDSTSEPREAVITNGLLVLEELPVLYSREDLSRQLQIRMQITIPRLPSVIIPILEPEMDSLWFETGIMNQQTLDTRQPTVRVARGDSLTGWIRLRFNSPHAGILIMMSQFSNWMPPSTDTVSVASLLTPAKRAFQYIPNIHYQAPTRPGTYWLTWTFTAEPAAVWIASSTSWRCGTPVWTDGNEKGLIASDSLAALWGHGGRLHYRKRLCEPGEVVRYESGHNPGVSVRVIVE